MKPLLIRADASSTMGIGHVMRCLSLAQEYKKIGGEVHVLKADTSADVDAVIESFGVQVAHLQAEPGTDADAQETNAYREQSGADWVILDGYHFSSDYQRALKAVEARVLFFDDYGHCSYYCTDFVLNQNITADAKLYKKKAAETELLLGTDYVLLREEFAQRGVVPHAITNEATNILVSLGGADPHNVSSTALRALALLKDPSLQVQVIVGAANPHKEALEEQANSAEFSVEIACNVSNIIERMQWADLAVSAAGTTTWELLFMGVPFITGYFAENQMAIAQKLAAMHLAKSVDSYTEATPEQIASLLGTMREDKTYRSQVSAGGQRFIDGKGVQRVIELLQ